MTPEPGGDEMGEDAVRVPGPHSPGDGGPRRPAAAREVPLSHVLLCLVVVTLGAAMASQHRPAAPLSASAAVASQASHPPGMDPLIRVADGVLLRAAFSVVPDLRQAQPDDPSLSPRSPASLSAPMLGASGLRPAGLLRAAPPDGSATTERASGTSGILWAAYEQAVRRVSPRCQLQTSLLAAIGEVESGSLAGRRLDGRHNVQPPVFGPVLAGGRVAAIRDTDDGRWDGNRTWDRAVGPMQFIPGTWRTWGSDGNGDGIADPQNVEDAAYSAARYLCAGGRDLSSTRDLRAAILSYNRSLSYLARVLELMGTIEPGSLPNLRTLETVAPGTTVPAVPSSPSTGWSQAAVAATSASPSPGTSSATPGAPDPTATQSSIGTAPPLTPTSAATSPPASPPPSPSTPTDVTTSTGSLSSASDGLPAASDDGVPAGATAPTSGGSAAIEAGTVPPTTP